MAATKNYKIYNAELTSRVHAKLKKVLKLKQDSEEIIVRNYQKRKKKGSKTENKIMTRT